MTRYLATIQTPIDVQAVFDDLCRFDRAERWDPGVAEATMLTAEPVGVGTRFRVVARFAGRSVPLEYEVLEYERPERIVLQAETRTFRSTDTITFTTNGAGTLVVYSAVLDAVGIARLAEPLLALVFRRIGDRAASGLWTYLNPVPST